MARDVSSSFCAWAVCVWGLPWLVYVIKCAYQGKSPRDASCKVHDWLTLWPVNAIWTVVFLLWSIFVLGPVWHFPRWLGRRNRRRQQMKQDEVVIPRAEVRQ